MMAAVATHERAAQDIRDICEGLSLIYNTRSLPVYLQTIPTETTAEFPAIFVTFEGETEETVEATFEDDDNVYSVRVFIADRHPHQDVSTRATYLKWRKQLLDAFRVRTSLPSVDECYNVTVRPQVVFDPKLPHYQYIVSGFIVQVHCREVRGG